MTTAYCEFCDLDGMGNHAPRCPVFLEQRIAELEAAPQHLWDMLTEDGYLTPADNLAQELARRLGIEWEVAGE